MCAYTYNMHIWVNSLQNESVSPLQSNRIRLHCECRWTLISYPYTSETCNFGVQVFLDEICFHPSTQESVNKAWKVARLLFLSCHMQEVIVTRQRQKWSDQHKTRNPRHISTLEAQRWVQENKVEGTKEEKGGSGCVCVCNWSQKACACDVRSHSNLPAYQLNVSLWREQTLSTCPLKLSLWCDTQRSQSCLLIDLHLPSHVCVDRIVSPESPLSPSHMFAKSPENRNGTTGGKINK